MENKTKIVSVIVLVLIAGNVFFGAEYFLAHRQIQALQRDLKVQRTNAKIVEFLNLFTSMVLKNNSEVSFDDRLKLENAVRNFGDKSILDQWEKFTSSQTEAQAQKEVTNLLDLLIKKIVY